MKTLIALSLLVSSLAFANEHAKKEEHKAAEVKTEAAVNPCEGLKDKEFLELILFSFCQILC